MKVKFIIDKEYDTKMIWKMLSKKDPADIENRAKRMGIPIEKAKEFQNKKWEEIKHLAVQLAELRYSKLLPFMKKSAELYQKSWNEINDEFSNIIEEKTNCEWKYDEYLVVVSAFHPGISSRKGNKVCKIWDENPYTQRRITAHEILMTHIWNILDTKFKHSLSELKAWALNEVTTTAILSLEPELTKFWPWCPPYENYLTNYPQIWELRDKLKPLWVERKSFKDYMKNAIKITHEYTLT